MVGTNVTFQLSPFLIPLFKTVTHPSTVCDPVPCFVLLHNTCYLPTCQVFDSLLSMIWLPTPESTPHQGREVFRFTPCCAHSRAWLGAGADYTCVQCCQKLFCNSSVLCLYLDISSGHPGKEMIHILSRQFSRPSCV